MRGITIVLNDESIHTGNDLDLVQEEKEIGKPKIQSYEIEVPGRNGLLNLTKSLTGEVAYLNRTLRFRYFGSGKRSELLAIDEAFNRYHGETIQIIDDDYPDHYYEGEASVSSEIYGNYIIVILTVDAQAFRFAREQTSKNFVSSTEKTWNFEYTGFPVAFTLQTSKEVTVTFNGITTTFSSGKYMNEGYVLKRGNNTIKLSANSNVTIFYTWRDI